MYYYAVSKGRQIGIYHTWDECKEQVNGYSGAQYKKFSTLKDAQNYLFPDQKKESQIDEVELYVDGGCNRLTGIEGWGSCVNQSGIDMVQNHQSLFKDMLIKLVDLPKGQRYICVAKFDDVQMQNNNGAELMAMIMALRMAVNGFKVKKIFSDSELIVTWWSNGIVNRNKLTQSKLKYIDELIELKKQFLESGGQIIKIPGDQNLADLGFHK